MIRSRILILSIFLPVMCHAQEKLSLQDAIAVALKNNYSITISRNEQQMAVNDNTLGNAGILPTLGLNANGSKSTNDTKQNYSSGLEVDKKNVTSSNLGAGAALNWTIFDGLKMFATHDKLRELQDKGELNARLEIENAIEQIITSYFDVVKQKQLLNATADAISIYEERARIAETKFNIGSSSKLDMLQAKVDLNEQRASQLKEQTALSNSKINLNRLLARAADMEFDATDSIVITYHPKLEELKTTVGSQNTLLLSSQKDVSISLLAIREVQAQRYPRVGLFSNYIYSKAENGAGFILLNQNLGFNYGFTVSWNLFNGSVINSQVKNAKLDYQNTTLRLSDVKAQVEAELLMSYKNFEAAMQALSLEEDNLLLAKENVTVALERYRIGKSTQIELRLAQQSLIDAENRTVSARYDAKVAETGLMKLNGGLVR